MFNLLWFRGQPLTKLPLDQHPLASKMLCRFLMPGKQRKAFQLALLRMNICRAAPFHDLDNLSEDLARYGIFMDQHARPAG